MHPLTKLIKNDMKPALGVTEPGAIAFAVATAAEHLHGPVEHVYLRLNSGMYKNAYTCGIPGSHETGNYYAAALGAVAADPKKGLECLEGIGPEAEKLARDMVERGCISVELGEITSRISIEASVTGSGSEASVTIKDSHINIVEIKENGTPVYIKEAKENTVTSSSLGTDTSSSEKELPAEIHGYSFSELLDYARTVPISEIGFIRQAFEMNYELLLEGLESDRTTFGPYLFKVNGGQLVSDDEQRTASLFCNGAIEARVLGLSRPAMSITGSGAHGIIDTMPLYASYKVRGYTEEELLRATALSYLVCMYIKEYSGKLSAFCGCAIAAGTGMACGLVMLRGGNEAAMQRAINNMASSITGMICDGGNQGCTMKGVVAVDAAFASVEMAMMGVYIDSRHGINGPSPEETMKNMGLIASPGMVGTEKTIMDILDNKSRAV